MKYLRLAAVSIVMASLALAAIPDADARGSGSSGGRSGGSSHSRSKAATGFIRGHCKTSSCFQKHPGGNYAVPLTKNKN